MKIAAWMLAGFLGWGLLAQTGKGQKVTGPDDEKPEKTQPAATLVVDAIQKLYEDTQDYQASFDQVYKNKLMDETRKSSGKVYIKQPGKMRWEYTKPNKKLFVSDGKTLWVYEEEAHQVYKQPLTDSELPTAIAFLMGEGDLKKEFDYKLVENEKAKAKGLLVLELVPKKPTTQYKKLLFMVVAMSHQVERTIIVDSSGNTNSMRFSKVKTNKGVKDSKFTFSMPKGATLVE